MKKREETTCEIGLSTARSAFARSISAPLTRGRSPDSQVIAKPAAFPFRGTVANTPAARCLQWRDRAGISPASLFTRPNDEHLRKAPRQHIGSAWSMLWAMARMWVRQSWQVDVTLVTLTVGAICPIMGLGSFCTPAFWAYTGTHMMWGPPTRQGFNHRPTNSHKVHWNEKELSA